MEGERKGCKRERQIYSVLAGRTWELLELGRGRTGLR